MLNLGRKQKLTVVKKVEFGIYLGESREAGEKERVLLPAKQVPEGTKEGDILEVFLYRDSSDRMIATTREPKLTLGGLAVLEVVQAGKIGAFLDQVLVSLYLDKSSRLCATMKVYPFLKTSSPYVIGDTVEGLVYEISDNFGVFIAVDNQYSGLIPKREAQGIYKVGQKLKLRVTDVKEDGKLTLSARAKAHEQIKEDSENVYQIIEEFAGVLPFDDKASPEIIQREFGLSKAAFKRAVGHLLKEKQIELRDGKIWIRR